MRILALPTLVLHAALTLGCAQVEPEPPPPPKPDPDMSACGIKELRKSAVQGFAVPSPDGSRYAVNKKDARGTAQIYVGRTGGSALECITCDARPGGPKPERFKMQPRWHPSGKWLFLAVERDSYSPPPVLGWDRKYVEGQLQNGLWTNIWAVTPDGRQWQRLTDFQSGKRGIADGFTGPAFTPDGRQAVWSQIVDGNVLVYKPFGRWELVLADVVEKDGKPQFTNVRDITPKGMHWNEPGNFSPDGMFLFTGSTENDAQGMDQYILDIKTGQLTNLTKSPTVWDEHGVFSPDGEKILFMSAYPYRDDPKSSKILSIKTEFMLMNRDGTGLKQLTRFREPGYPEYSRKGGIAAVGEWRHDGRAISLARLFFPDYEYWDIEFKGACGSGGGR